MRPDAPSPARRAEAEPPGLALAPGARLALGRAHEACGPARRVLAALLAGRLAGPVLWILPAHVRERPNPEGCLPWFDPARLVLVPVPRAPDLLWCAEEALRSGAAPLVVADCAEPPGLTPVRRLHLAAEAGTARAGAGPLGLLLTPGEGGAQGVESRWHVLPLPGWAEGAGPRWRLARRRARAAPEAAWILEGEGGGGRLRPAAGPAPGAEG